MKIQWNNSAEIVTLERGHLVYPGVVAEAASADDIRAMDQGASFHGVGSVLAACVLGCPTRAQLKGLEASSIQAQEMARDTATIGYKGEAAEAQDALYALRDAWSAALDAADAGDIDALRDALSEAQSIERSWGDDSQSRAALAMLEGVES